MWKKAVHNDVAQVLQRKVEHFDADAARHLRKVLPCDAHPFLAVTDQSTAAAGVSREALAEARGKPVVPCGVHLDVIVEQLADLALAFWVHGQKILVLGLFPGQRPWLLQCLATIRFVTLHRYPPVR